MAKSHAISSQWRDQAVIPLAIVVVLTALFRGISWLGNGEVIAILCLTAPVYVSIGWRPPKLSLMRWWAPILTPMIASTIVSLHMHKVISGGEAIGLWVCLTGLLLFLCLKPHRLSSIWVAAIVPLSLIAIVLGMSQHHKLLTTAESIDLFLLATLVLVTTIYARLTQHISRSSQESTQTARDMAEATSTMAQATALQAEATRESASAMALQANATQEMAIAMGEQANSTKQMVREVQQQRIDSYRPVLVPLGGDLGIAAETQSIDISYKGGGWLSVVNIGPGPALNVTLQLEHVSEGASSDVLLGLTKVVVSPVPADGSRPVYQSATREPMKIPDNCRIVIQYHDVFGNPSITKARYAALANQWLDIEVS